MSKITENHKKAEKEFYSNIRPEILEIYESGREIPLSEWKEMRMNSYEMKLLEPRLSDEAFVHHFENALNNVSFPTTTYMYKLNSTYDTWVQSEGIVELLERFKKLI